jgi:hypothetical protein
MTPIRAEIVTDNLACVLGVTATGVLRLCEKLVHAGHDLATPLEAYRGDTLSLRVRSIGEGAWLLEPRARSFLAWTVTQVVFTLHYAHEYWWPAGLCRRARFPGRSKPGLLGFLLFRDLVWGSITDLQCVDPDQASAPTRDAARNHLVFLQHGRARAGHQSRGLDDLRGCRVQQPDVPGCNCPVGRRHHCRCARGRGSTGPAPVYPAH